MKEDEKIRERESLTEEKGKEEKLAEKKRNSKTSLMKLAKKEILQAEKCRERSTNYSEEARMEAKKVVIEKLTPKYAESTIENDEYSAANPAVIS